jgi:hypothetical protein
MRRGETFCEPISIRGGIRAGVRAGRLQVPGCRARVPGETRRTDQGLMAF